MLAPLTTVRLIASSPRNYAVRLARSSEDIRAAQALRYAVFNLELKEGLAESAATGLDQDSFDATCDHLLVEHVASGEVVGTYRMQTGRMAQRNGGYYSEQEFDFHPFEGIRDRMVELGRACVHQQHRHLTVLGLLWKGIAEYAGRAGARYLCGCSSLSEQDPRIGASAYAELCRRHLAQPEFRTQPRAPYECPLDQLAEEAPKIPKLLRAYLSLGAKICGPPALDQGFKTIDFLTLLDLDAMPAAARERFLC